MKTRETRETRETRKNNQWLLPFDNPKFVFLYHVGCVSEKQEGENGRAVG